MRNRVPRTVLVLISLVNAWACGGGATSSDAVTTDSAGIRVITSGASDAPLPWRFEQIDVFRDTLGEPWLFTGVNGRTMITDRAGRTYVLTRDPSIVRFGRDGRYERTIGRKGGGPGEMQFPITLRTKGDTLVVFDVAKRALVRWGPTLDPIGDRRLEGALADAQEIVFRTGGLWFRRQEMSDSAVGVALFADTLGEPLHRVVMRSGGAVQFGCIGLNYATPLFSPTIVFAANGPRIVVSAQPEYAIWLHEGPRSIASIRRPLPARRPTVADVRALYPDGFKVGFGGARADCVVPLEELIAKQGLADAVPAVYDLALLRDGTIWALRTPLTVQPAVVDVFGSDGVYLGTTRGRRLPLDLLPNGELLVPQDDSASGGLVIARMKVTR